MDNEKVSTLYSLTDEYMRLLMMAEDPEIDSQLIEDTLEGLGGEIEIKADGYAKVIAELNIKAEEIRGKGNAVIEEGKRINAVADSIDKNIERMKNNLQKAMETTGKTKFKTEFFSFNIKKNPPKVVVTNEADVLPEYLKIKTEVDKKAIGESLKKGIELGFAHLEQGQSLQIK